MAQRSLNYAEARATAKAYNAAGGNAVHAATAVGMNASTFDNRVRVTRQKWPKLLKSFKLSRGGHKPTIKPEATIAEHVELHRHQREAGSYRSKFKDSLKTIAELEDRLKDLEWAAKGSFEPAEWSLPSHKRQKSEHMPYLLTSDAQLGEVIKAEETEAGYGYDVDTYRRRHRRVIDTTIYLSFSHAGALWKYPGIIYARGGDTISGGIHDELRDTDELTPIEACEVAFEEESAGIYKLADAFGRVDVKTPGAAGNHDRDTLKPRTKNASGHSYDRLIAYMLRREFARDKRVTFQTSRSFDVRFPIYEQTILLTHGDRMGSSGGQGFIGPMATIMRGAQKVMAEQAALGFKIDRVDHGHYHTPGYLGWVLSNGCYPGYSEYAKSYRMRPSPPQQFLLYHHHKRGVVDIKPIILTEA